MVVVVGGCLGSHKEKKKHFCDGSSTHGGRARCRGRTCHVGLNSSPAHTYSQLFTSALLLVTEQQEFW